jgi:hypothetical protein
MAGVAAARVRQLRVLRDQPVATDMSAELGEAAFKQHGVGANAVQNCKQNCHQEFLVWFERGPGLAQRAAGAYPVCATIIRIVNFFAPIETQD